MSTPPAAPYKSIFLGAWTLPSGTSFDVYLDLYVFLEKVAPTRAELRVRFEWDRPTDKLSHWPLADIRHWRTAIYPEIHRAIATATGIDSRILVGGSR